MNKLILAFLVAVCAQASTLSVTVRGTTPQQILVDVRASDNTACTVQVSTKSDFSVLAHDVDTSLFSGSNACNRSGVIVSGNDYQMTIGKRTAQKGADGLMYSRSLAWNQVYYLKFTLASGATQTVSATTKNPPLGNSAPDPLPFDTNGNGNFAFPTIDYNNFYAPVIDPMTGAPLYQMWHPGDSGWITNNSKVENLNKTIDLGSSWTIGGGIVGTCSGAACTSDAIVSFSIFDTSIGGGGFRIDISQDQDDIVDTQLHLNGFASGSGTDAQVYVCLSNDLGKTCESDAITMTLPTGSAGDVYSDSGRSPFPSPYFKDWGGVHVKWRADQISLGGWIGTFANGNTFTSGGGSLSPSGAPGGEFPVSLFIDIPNYPIYISGTAPYCTDNLCHVAKVINSTTIKTVETISALTTTTTLASDFKPGDTTIHLTSGTMVTPNYDGTQDVTINGTNYACEGAQGQFDSTTINGCPSPGSTISAGTTVGIGHWVLPSTSFKIWKVTGTGSVTINSASANFNNARPPSTGAEANEGDISCSSENVTVSVADDGVTPIAPQRGEECTFKQAGDSGGTGNLYLVLPSTGESRKIATRDGINTRSSAYNVGDGINYRAFSNGQTCMHVYDGSWATLSNAHNPSDPSHMTDLACSTNDNFGNTQANPVTLITQAHPEIDLSYLGSWIGPVSSGQRYIYTTSEGQNHEYWWCDVDLSLPSGPAQVTFCDNSWSHYPNRWAVSHSSGAHAGFGQTSDQVGTGPLAMQMSYSSSEYDFKINTVYNNGGTTALTNTFTDATQTCSQMGVTDQRWIDRGSTGHNCIRLNIATDPLWTNTPGSSTTWTGTTASGGQTAQLSASKSGSTLTLSGGSAAASYNKGSYSYTGSYATTVTGGGTGWMFAFLDTSGAVSFESNLTGTCSNCGSYTKRNNPYFPDRTIPLWDWHVTSGVFDSTGTDFRRFPLGVSMISGRPYPWAHNSSSCGGDNSTTTCGAYLTTLQPGDMLFDAANGALREAMLVSLVTPLADGSIDVVVARQPTDILTGNSIAKDSHASGWTGAAASPEVDQGGTFLVPFSTAASYNAGTNTANYVEEFALNGSHGESYQIGTNFVAVNSAQWNYIDPLGGFASGYGIRIGALPGIMSKPFQYGSNAAHGFDNVLFGAQVPTGTMQSHPGGMTWGGTPRESGWALDGTPPGPAGGGNLSLSPQTVSLVSGKTQTYLIGPFTAGDYYANGNLLTSSMTPLTLKTRATYAWVGRYLLKNMSSSNSASTWGASSDSQPWTYCVAAFSGECVSGSSAGQEFVSAPSVDTSGTCAMSPTETHPCIVTSSPVYQKAIQFDISKDDTFGLRWRAITTGGTKPGSTLNYWNAQSDPEGNFVFVESDYPNNGQISTLLGAKLPPFPNEDSMNRTMFIPVADKLPGVSGSTVRVRFGYAEYGTDTNGLPLFCSDRKEDCTTSTSATHPSDPYSWLGESQTWKACSADCVVNIPGISGRVLYYVEDRQVGGVTYTSPLKSVVVN